MASRGPSYGLSAQVANKVSQPLLLFILSHFYSNFSIYFLTLRSKLFMAFQLLI